MGIVDELTKLKKLLDEGAITSEEYGYMKSRIISGDSPPADSMYAKEQTLSEPAYAKEQTPYEPVYAKEQAPPEPMYAREQRQQAPSESMYAGEQRQQAPRRTGGNQRASSGINPKFVIPLVSAAAVIAFVIIGGGLMGWGPIKFGGEENKTLSIDVGSEDDNDDPVQPEDETDEPDAFNLVWKVEPELDYGNVYYCFCGFFGIDDYTGGGIDPDTGLTNTNEHLGHGGGFVSYYYDEKMNLYGFYGGDEGGIDFKMKTAKAFLSDLWNPYSLYLFQKIESDKVTKYETEWGGEDYDFSNANISEKFAVAYGTTFVSDFIYDFFDKSEGWDYGNDNADNIIAVMLDGKWGILDNGGKTIVPFLFQDIVLIDENTAFAKINGKYGILDINKTAYPGGKESGNSGALSTEIDPDDDDTFPYGGEIFVTNFSDKNIFIRSEPVVNGEKANLNDGNKIGWIEKGDTSVELIATGNEYLEDGNGHWWYEVRIPQWYRDTPKQTENYAGKPLVGWVRDDIVRLVG